MYCIHIINIISIKNGEYLLTKNNIYYTLPYNKTKIIEIKKNDNSLLLSIGNSETSLIDNLRYSGLFEKKTYLGEKILFGPLLNGRHRCFFNVLSILKFMIKIFKFMEHNLKLILVSKVKIKFY